MAVLTKEQADLLMNVQPTDRPIIKQLAYYLCRSGGCDPETKTVALANGPLGLPEGYEYQIWQYRLYKLRNIIWILEEENVITPLSKK